MEEKKNGWYDRFLNWVHTAKPGDGQVIFGGEVIAVALVLFYKFSDSSWYSILKTEYHSLFLCAMAGLFILLAAGIGLLGWGISIKSKSNNK